jgi:hypothetical protein
MLLPIRHPKRPKKREYDDLFSGRGYEKVATLLLPVSDVS